MLLNFRCDGSAATVTVLVGEDTIADERQKTRLSDQRRLLLMGFCKRTSCARAAVCVSSLLLRAPTWEDVVCCPVQKSSYLPLSHCLLCSSSTFSHSLHRPGGHRHSRLVHRPDVCNRPHHPDPAHRVLHQEKSWWKIPR